MTLDDLIDALRRERLSDTVVPYQYSDETLTAALNDAVRQASIRKRLLLDRTTEECCSYAVTADADATGAMEVTLHPRVLAIRSARYTGVTEPLVLTTLKTIDKCFYDWPDEVAGDPSHLIVDAHSGKVLLWPTPDTDGTLSLSVWRGPLESEEMEIGDDEPVVDELWHRGLLDWAEYQAYLTRDGETGDSMRATAALARFTAAFGRQPSAHEIKCWGLAPPRGQRAEFL